MPNPKIKTQSAILQGVNPKQAQAIAFGQGPLLIIAGAGTGKTTVLTRRIAWLIEQELAKPEEILALTFTEKAAAEMSERVDQLMPLGYAEISISTFHAFAQKILQEHALEIGLPGSFKVLTETQAWMLLHRHLDELSLDYYRPMGNPGRFIHSLLKHFGKAKGEGITPEAYLDYARQLQQGQDAPAKRGRKKSAKTKMEPEPDQTETARVAEVANAYQVYQKLLLEQGFLDFGDLINYAIRLFSLRPKILKLYQQRFKYILVDEFQDTDLAQYELIKMIAQPQNNLTVVGDDDQSIYKFRGASISNILKFVEDFPKAREISLTDNYRSSQAILDLAYGFIQLNNPERLEAKRRISKKLSSHAPGTGEISVLHAPDVFQEAAAVADKITELADEQGFNLNDFAILVRANDHADPFVSELGKRGIPYMFVANRGLYKKPFILDLLAYLKLLDDYHETENLFRVLNFKKFSLAHDELIGLSQTAKKRAWSLYESVKNAHAQKLLPDEDWQKLDRLLVFINRHTGWARTKPVTELLVRVLDELEITKDLAHDSAENAENRSLLQQFYSKAQRFETESDDKGLRSFLAHVRMELESGDTGDLAFDPNVGPEAVKVMTIHSSKGLEFKCVFIVNMVEARFPSRDRREQIEVPQELVREILAEGDVHLMEERRLFYVAVTRAKEYLYLTWASDYGGVSAKKPSRFLVEAGLERPAAKPAPTGAVVFAPPQPLPIKAGPRHAIPESFSWTSLSSFMKCPLEFKYRYLYQLPTAGNGYTSFGQTIHSAIQQFSQLARQMNAESQGDLFGKRPAGRLVYPSLKQLHQLYEESWIDDWYDNQQDKQRFKKRGYRLLENFHRKMTESQILPTETEKFFRLKLGDYKCTGKIDCYYEHPDGSISIIDYKTSQKARTKLEKVDKKQLLVYQWAAQEFLKRRVNDLSYWDLEDLSGIIEFLGTDEEIQSIKSEFLQTIDEIISAVRNNNFLELDKRRSHDCQYRNYES